LSIYHLPRHRILAPNEHQFIKNRSPCHASREPETRLHMQRNDEIGIRAQNRAANATQAQPPLSFGTNS